MRCVVSDVAQFNFVQHPFPLFKHGRTVHHDMVGSLSTSFTRTIWCVVESAFVHMFGKVVMSSGQSYDD